MKRYANHISGRGLARRRGAAMSEMVLVLPLLMLILSLLFLFGRLMVRATHTQVAARYETWRDVADAPGPASWWDDDIDRHNHSEINDAFFGGNAESLAHHYNDASFPEQAYRDLIEFAELRTDTVGQYIDTLLYEPDGDPRLSHGHREGFSVLYRMDVPLWRRFERPIDRHAVRIGHEWLFTNDWRAGADRWTGSGGGSPHQLRALRDVFLRDIDERLDAIDGETDPEYPGDDTERATNQVLASFIRSLYLHEPGYVGPIVYDERP